MAITDIDRSLFSADVVQIRRFDSDLNTFDNAYPNARPMKATVSETGQLMTHTIEDGSSITDHRIIYPTVITIAVIIDPRLFTFRPIDFEFSFGDTYRSVYNSIRNDFSLSTQFEIQTKSRTYDNMYLQSIPHEEDPRQFDTITMILEFSEAKFVAVVIQDLSEDQVRDMSDASTLDKGENSGTDVMNQGASVLSGWYDSFRSLTGG